MRISSLLRYLVAVLVLTSFAGCTSVYSMLSPAQKRDIYERVSEDVKGHVERATFLRGSGYLHEALSEYQQAQFYGDLAPVVPETIELLKNQIQTESKAAYNQGQKALAAKDYEKALREFNKVMRTDPDYADAEKYYWRMLNRPENARRISELESQLWGVQRSLRNAQDKNKKQRRQQQAESLSKEILAYQYDNSLAYDQHMGEFETYLEQRRNGMAQVRQGYHLMLSGDFDAAAEAFKKARATEATAREGVNGLYRLQKRKDAIYLTNLAGSAFRRGDLAQAEERAVKAVDADKEYAPASLMLKKIVRQRLALESDSILSDTRKMIADGDYRGAMEAMEDILHKEPQHKEARALYVQARDALKASIEDYIELGSVLFNQSRYDEASDYFDSVLMVEPENHIAQTYLKRIILRKQTLQMFNTETM